ALYLGQNSGDIYGHYLVPSGLREGVVVAAIGASAVMVLSALIGLSRSGTNDGVALGFADSAHTPSISAARAATSVGGLCGAGKDSYQGRKAAVTATAPAGT
ncbi:hypothetical protein K7G98_38585, partial [Saccharothrix sp. MB29]|nr:hypothetical protein [Saccharothrix sp. MB29]